METIREYVNLGMDGEEETCNIKDVIDTQFTDKGKSIQLRDVLYPLIGVNVIPSLYEEVTPHIGQKFSSIEESYNFYNVYARLAGFSVRKWLSFRDKADGSIKKQQFCCSKQGARDKKRVMDNKSGKEHQPITRVGCEAYLEVKRGTDNQFEIIKFVNGHNHDLHTPSKANMHRSQKSLDEASQRLVEKWSSSGLPPRKIFDVLSHGAGGPDKLALTEYDVSRHVREVRRRTYGKEATTVLNYFREKTRNDPNFFFSIQVNDEFQMGNCFWVDGHSRADYHCFGDVLIFDTTYKTNKFLMPFAPFTGVNSHRQSILFGCALLVEESQTSFEWLFEEWLKAMGGNPPNAIITDQDPAMGPTIAKVMPSTRHRYCKWHILQKFPEKIPRLANSEEFSRDFKRCIYECETPEEFEAMWSNLINKYELMDVSWLNDLYSIRDKWLQVYMRDVFFAGMSTTQRSESMNKMFKGYFDKHTSLTAFVELFDKAVQFRRSKETKQDYDTCNSNPICTLGIALEKHMAQIYTKKVFKTCQRELLESLKYVVTLVEKRSNNENYEVFLEEGMTKKYKISYLTLEEKASCSCGRLEFEGIVCRHIFAILHKVKFKIELPSCYILKRWTRYAKCGTRPTIPVTNYRDQEHEWQGSTTLRFNEASFRCNQVATLAASSKRTFQFAISRLQMLEAELHVLIKEDEVELVNEVESVGNVDPSIPQCSSKELGIVDPNIVRSKGSGKRYKAIRELWSRKSKRIEKQPLESKPQRKCHNCDGHGHDSRNCTRPKKVEQGIVNISNM